MTFWQFDDLAISSPVKILEHAFSELDRASDRTRLNPAMTPITQLTKQVASHWMLWVHLRFPSITPYIVIPGDGGLIVEWAQGEHFVSLNLDAEDRDLDLIVYKLSGTQNVVDLNDNLLEALISVLDSHDLFTRRINKNVRCEKDAKLWADFAGSSFTASASG